MTITPAVTTATIEAITTVMGEISGVDIVGVVVEIGTMGLSIEKESIIVSSVFKTSIVT